MPQATSIITYDDALMQMSGERVRRTQLGRAPFPPSPTVRTARVFAVANNIRPGVSPALLSAFLGRVHVYPISPSQVSLFCIILIFPAVTLQL